eukprot:TRINITY_DN7099_c0_g1_i1.p1 TRINITY_DN7099_c0_g1~~TRINITY_DN7099_c0_g1_i1.p1  ORF type:complete len:148 (+),score=35.55 TRINITY_DN7099_c0_g1_i1:71-514(+)
MCIRDRDTQGQCTSGNIIYYAHMEAEAEIWSALGNYFKLIADGEQKLDVSRRVLTEGGSFEPEQCFAILAGENKPYITAIDLFDFLTQYFSPVLHRDNEVEVKEMECYRIIRAYDSTNTCHLLYLSLIHICRCRRYAVCRSRWSPYH